MKDKKTYSFYQVLKVLYYLIDEESKNDKGELLKKMNRTKKLISQLAADLGNLALLNNWYDLYQIETEKLEELIDYDELKGFSPKIK